MALSYGIYRFVFLCTPTRSLVESTHEIYLYGLSLGSVFALDLANESRVEGIVIEGGPTTGEAMIKLYQSRRLFGSLINVTVDDSLNFDSIQQTRKINKPILVIHGEEDQNIPFSMGQAIFDAATHPGSSFFPVKDGNHCDTFYLVPEQFLSRIGQFIAG